MELITDLFTVYLKVELLEDPGGGEPAEPDGQGGEAGGAADGQLARGKLLRKDSQTSITSQRDNNVCVMKLIPTHA